jgi:inorganic triphosphatase YgiF
MPAAQAALQVLGSRLALITKYLPQVLQEPGEDLEAVHQLRVGTRRCGAALKLFRDVLPKKWVRHSRVTLRNIRQTVGAARDWDVFLLRLQKSAAMLAHPEAHILLVGLSLGHRGAAQTKIAEQCLTQQLEYADLLSTFPELEELNLGGPTFGELAISEMALLLADFSSELSKKSRGTAPIAYPWEACSLCSGVVRGSARQPSAR